jgi:fimbrial isopeptide formation D2 family protein/LPXTG-motif cell wall-anchored protein
MAAYVGFTTNTSDVNSKLNDAEALVAKKSKDGIDSKESNDSDKVVAIGDTITYTVTAEIPNFDPSEDDTTFKIVDTITGAEYYLNGPDSVNSVEINGYAGDDPAVPSIEADGSSFTVDLSAFINDENSFAGKMVTIQYTVKVTDVTVDNTASITRGLKTETGSKSESLYTGQITLTKYDDASNGLANAEFVLTKGNDETALTFDAATIKDGVRVYTYNPNGDVTELITDENGKLIVEGLDVGKYHFTETKAPTGYSINESGADAELKLDDDADTASAKLTDTTSLSDSKLSALPSTGGIGTTIFTIAGCLIMITAAGLYFASRRKSAK